jgi:hypothetical protein
MRLLLSGIINVTQLVGVATSLWTMDRFGRRPLLLTGADLMFAVGRPLHRRLGRRGLPVLLHVQLRGYMGARALGYAQRNFPEQSEGKGSGVEHV